jgi:uncharacterized protein with PQ loop repeat
MDTTEVVGFCSLCLGVIQGFPQYYKIHKENNTSSFSWHSLIIGMFASLLSLLYGFLKHSPTVIVGSLVGIATTIYILSKMKMHEDDED